MVTKTAETLICRHCGEKIVHNKSGYYAPDRKANPAGCKTPECLTPNGVVTLHDPLPDHSRLF